MGHARTLLALPTKEQQIATQYIIDKSLSVRETERYIKKLISPSTEKILKEDALVVRYRELLSTKLKSKANLSCNKKGKGSVKLFFNDFEKLESILNQLSDQ